VKNQHADLREWLEYHKWLGVGKVYVYDNNSTVRRQASVSCNDSVVWAFVPKRHTKAAAAAAAAAAAVLGRLHLAAAVTCIGVPLLMQQLVLVYGNNSTARRQAGVRSLSWSHNGMFGTAAAAAVAPPLNNLGDLAAVAGSSADVHMVLAPGAVVSNA
jgi:hypothetical protein